MDFMPIVRNVRSMDPRIFLPQLMGLATVLLDRQMSERLSYDVGRNTLFANFEGMGVRSTSDVESVRRVLEAFCDGIGHKVSLIVNYDGFRLDDPVADTYFAMVRRLQLKYYSSATRFSASAFMRVKLGAAFCEVDAESHVCETHAQAASHVASQLEDEVGRPLR
jgi:propionate CoA-transferase